MKNKFLNLILILAFVFSGFSVYADDIDPPADPIPTEDSVPADTIPPVIVLNGEPSFDLYVAQDYVDAGATASDDIDGDITASIIVDGLVDTSTPGIYSISYNVADSSLNQAVTVSRTVTVKEIPKVNIHLEIETSSGSIYHDDLEVSACITDNTNTYKLSPYCALSSSGVGVGWSWWGEDAFLSEINGVVNNSNDNGVYWGWFANLELGQVALNKYTLKAGDSILLNYDINPIRILADNVSPKVGDSVNFTVQSFGYDGSWNPVWSNVSDAVIKIGLNSLITDSNGKATYIIDSSGEIKASAHKDGFIDSNNIILSVPVVVENPSGGGPNNSVFSVSNANNFLLSKQNPDGSFGEMLYTDWVAISAGVSNAPFFSSLKNYLQNNPLNSNVVTDNERHAMALMSLGINPYTGTGVNYIQKIVDSFDGVQIGDPSLINDDVFGLIVLGKAGYTQNDDLISKDISYLISKQASDGSFENSVDMTAAVIQALRIFDNNSEAISKAENYLISNQNQADGGFGNNFSTSWVIQAISSNANLLENTNKADSYLANNQKIDGGMENLDSDISNRIWATSYSVLAGMHKSFGDALNSFPKYAPQVLSSGINKIEKEIPLEVPKIELIIDTQEKIEEPADNNVANNQANAVVLKEEVIKNIEKEEITVDQVVPENNLTASAASSPISDKIFKAINDIFIGLVDFIKGILSYF